jgi:hypothetical protein
MHQEFVGQPAELTVDWKVRPGKAEGYLELAPATSHSLHWASAQGPKTEVGCPAQSYVCNLVWTT